MRNWDNFLYDLADRLFGKQMDKAYNQGIRIGAEYAARKMSFAVSNADVEKELTKTQLIGYKRAQQELRSVKKEIHAQTGAML